MNFKSLSLKYCAWLLFIILIGTSCSTHNNPTPPEKATLTFPVQNSLCTSGTVVSNTQSSVTFIWSAAPHTDSYELSIKNLITGIIVVQTASTNQLTVTLQRNTPYAWYVVSKSNSVSTIQQSDTFKFYLAGLGVTSYSPFPANIVSPGFGTDIMVTAGTVNLSWTGSDVDGDIIGYDVYFGTLPNPPLNKNNVTDMFLNNVAVTSGVTYYWKVITKDSQGNTSDSGIYQFKVN